MPIGRYPENFLRFNDQQNKNLIVVVQIEGVSELLTTGPLYTRIRYGDPITYGSPGLVYGGLRAVPGIRDYISLDSALSLNQKLEPEQGKSSISTLSISLIDKDGWGTQLVSPGIIVDEIFGKKIKVWLGHKETSYPEDYISYFQGYISAVKLVPGKVLLQISDANIRRRNQTFYEYSSTNTLDVGVTDTTVTVGKTDGAYRSIVGPDGTRDSSIKTYIKIENEWMQYNPATVTANTFTVQRGSSYSRGTQVATHAAGQSLSQGIEVSGNAMDLALKIMLSGWKGPWISGVKVKAILQTYDLSIGLVPSGITLPDKVDAVQDYGLVVGDTVTISGSAVGNNVTGVITDIQDIGDSKNQIIVLDQPLTLETVNPAVTLSFRSQFDTLPTNAGLRMTPQEVDVQSHLDIRRRFFSTGYNLRFFVDKKSSGKEFIEQEIYRPLGAYSVTRYGRLSLNLTLPPIAGEKLVILDKDNILDPGTITVSRSLNSRRFYNVIKFSYDLADDGTYQSILEVLDSTSLNQIGIDSTLNIASSGIRSDLGGSVLARRQGQHLLNRFKNAAYEVTVKVNFRAATQIQVGDIIVLKDEGNLQIANLDTGERDVGVKLFEVIDYKPDIKTGVGDLTLLSNIGFGLDDRYATISPSSLVDVGSATTSVKIKASFGAVYGKTKEHYKWKDYAGLPLHIHSPDYSRSSTAVLVGIDPSDNYRLVLDTPLSFTPQAGDIVDIADYPTDTIVKTNQLYKILHGFATPALSVASAASQTVLTLVTGQGAIVNVGLPMLVHNADYTLSSPECIVLSVVGDTVTLKTPLGFIPAVGMTAELIGYKDNGGPYRWV